MGSGRAAMAAQMASGVRSGQPAGMGGPWMKRAMRPPVRTLMMAPWSRSERSSPAATQLFPGYELDGPGTFPRRPWRLAAAAGFPRAARLAWEREHEGEVFDPETLRSEILPGLRNVRTIDLSRMTGLSMPYCAQIKKGERVPHPMYRGALEELREPSPPRDPPALPLIRRGTR